MAGLLAMQHVDPHEREKHQQASANREKHKFDRGVDALFVSPNPDKKKHGNKLSFPKQVEQKQVSGQEDTQNAGLHR